MASVKGEIPLALETGGRPTLTSQRVSPSPQSISDLERSWLRHQSRYTQHLGFGWPGKPMSLTRINSAFTDHYLVAERGPHSRPQFLTGKGGAWE